MKKLCSDYRTCPVPHEWHPLCESCQVIDVDPAILADMERRLAEPKPEPKPVSIFDRD